MFELFIFINLLFENEVFIALHTFFYTNKLLLHFIKWFLNLDRHLRLLLPHTFFLHFLHLHLFILRLHFNLQCLNLVRQPHIFLPHFAQLTLRLISNLQNLLAFNRTLLRFLMQNMTQLYFQVLIVV